MLARKSTKNSIEPLEARIAPAAATPTTPFLPTDPTHYVKAVLNTPVEVRAGEVLTTTGTPNSGEYLLFVEQGNALVFLTDLNGNGQVDFNEITGIAAGNGLKMIAFTDIHGDIVTNLVETPVTTIGANGAAQTRTVLSLSDSDNNPANDNPATRGDGRVLLDNRIDTIELRSLTPNDIPDQNGDGVVDQTDVNLRKAPSTYSIFGNIYAGGGFGSTTGGLTIDTTGLANFGFEADTHPRIGSILVGTAASNQFFSFGASNQDDTNGTLLPFVPKSGEAGGSIIGVKAAQTGMAFDIDTLQAGNGGIGAKGGDIVNVTLGGDDTGGYKIIAGTGGSGPSGGAGGSVVNFSDLGSSTGQVVISSGDGGVGVTAGGGSGGNLTFNQFNLRGNVSIDLGNGGNGFTSGGNGASLVKGIFTQPGITSFIASNGTGATHMPSSLDDTTVVNGQPVDSGTRTYTPIIGTHEIADFDGDGIGDFVYVNQVTSQLVVQLSNAKYGGVPETIYLSGVRNPDALEVADLNGDGHPDIAVASADLGSQNGIEVFLSQYEHNGPGNLTTSEDKNHNNINDFVGFSAPRYSPLPQLSSTIIPTPGNPANIGTGLIAGGIGVFSSPTQIGSITAGDFDGDGRPELAVVATYYELAHSTNGVIDSLAHPAQVLIYMTADREANNLIKDPVTGQTPFVEYTGQFYADFGTPPVQNGTTTTPAIPKLPVVVAADAAGGVPEGSVIIEATALSTTATHDVILKTTIGAKSVVTIDYSVRNSTLITFPGEPPIVVAEAAVTPGSYAMGRVDTNRNVGANQINAQDFTVQGFTALDYDNDGNVDVAAISQSPGGFMIGSHGDGTGKGTQDSGNGADNSGNWFGGNGVGFNVGTTLLNIKSADLGTLNPLTGFPTGDGNADNIAVLHLIPGGAAVSYLNFVPGAQTAASATQGLISDNVADTFNGTGKHFFGLFYPGVVANPAFDPTNPASVAFISDKTVPDFATSDLTNQNFYGDLYGVLSTSNTGLFLFDLPIFRIGTNITAGNGGNATVGSGGTGGNLGGGFTFTTGIDPNTQQNIQILDGSFKFVYSGDIFLNAGNGGNGFANGGHGGDISGVSVQYRQDGAGLDERFTAGNGGRGTTGHGGDGGDLKGLSLESDLVSPNVQAAAIDPDSIFLNTGNGGIGATGGKGGSLIGNGSAVPDVVTLFLEVNQLYTDPITSLTVSNIGTGGSGTKMGGPGGSITNFHPNIFLDPNLGGDGTGAGDIFYNAGNGGSSVSGKGGDGGSIINSAPQKNSFVNDVVELQAGDGGSGAFGGNGGSINTFSIIYQNGAEAVSFDALGGQAGAGFFGKGGMGGSVAHVNVQARGGTSFFVATTTNRVLAGNGGASASGAGGDGGDIVDVSSSSDFGSFALVAGAGGDGLLMGGTGGNVLQGNLSLGASTSSKGLVVAGAGGNATAFIPNPSDSTALQAQNSFGGQVGRGGAGGMINGFTQRGGLATHMDLIGGNGGDTQNYGTVFDDVSFSGVGGSIENVHISGDLGNIGIDLASTPTVDEDVPIKSYNDLLNGESMASWVDTNLRGLSVLSTFLLTDSAGNVGIVVGAAGRNKAAEVDPVNDPGVFRSQPSSHSTNGDLINVTANHIMSAVAGSVERIAAINFAQNISTSDNTAGSDKGTFIVPNQPVEGVVSSDPNNYDYLDSSVPPNLVHAPVLDGQLIDGAFISHNRVALNGRVFIL